MGGYMSKKITKVLQRSIKKDGIKYGVTIAKDEDGYFATTHRSRSKSYPTKSGIPKTVLKRIESTG
jgi:hypothetical protein